MRPDKTKDLCALLPQSFQIPCNLKLYISYYSNSRDDGHNLCATTFLQDLRKRLKQLPYYWEKGRNGVIAACYALAHDNFPFVFERSHAIFLPGRYWLFTFFLFPTPGNRVLIEHVYHTRIPPSFWSMQIMWLRKVAFEYIRRSWWFIFLSLISMSLYAFSVLCFWNAQHLI